MEKLFLSIISTVCIFCILTIPHLTLMFFDWGINYTMIGMLMCSVASIFINSFIVMPYLIKKFKL